MPKVIEHEGQRGVFLPVEEDGSVRIGSERLAYDNEGIAQLTDAYDMPADWRRALESILRATPETDTP